MQAGRAFGGVIVRLENLPQAWRGRRAVLLSDLHLGTFETAGSEADRGQDDAGEARRSFRCRRCVRWHSDRYGASRRTIARAARAAGRLFCCGQSRAVRGRPKYLRAVAGAGVRVLENEKVEADGLQIVGVPYKHATHDEHLRAVLQRIGVDRNRASILLTHAPDRPHISAEAGFSLQLSGHTHLGQFIPWTWLVRRIYRQFAYGLSWIGKMQVYTSSGAGTWGPPLRFGSSPEIVLLCFE